MEIIYEIEFADNGIMIRSEEMVKVVEGNEKRINEELGKEIYADIDNFVENEATNKVKITIKIEDIDV